MKALFLGATGIKPHFFAQMKKHCQKINKMYHKYSVFGGALFLIYDLAVMLLFLGIIEISRSLVLLGTYSTFIPMKVMMITIGFLLLGIDFWMVLYHTALSFVDMANIFLTKS